MSDENTDESALNDEVKDAIKAFAMPIIMAAGTVALVAGASFVIEKLSTTNFKKSNLKGDKEYKPTEDKVSMSKVESSAKDTNASLAKDELKVKDGDLSAAKTDANALDVEATAAESGAAAARTKAGAADIETKALKMT